ncbi:anthranilate synthase, component I [Corynebacterium mustelae]|uniref:Anthranilate synthase component 1 n=1 Tax=Corynebacterium mustelae TaxID=571915 RepID=A0A0G3H891_9CORY|nr:anthranilate synthase component 1 [Corynebacterium mustelae]AKK07352.1 anthranilate synthase, component I [Corynebacterium mustelae]
MFHVKHSSVRYHADAAALFEALGGVTNPNTLLLESADIDSKKNTACMAIITAALRITCEQYSVTVDALTLTGEAMLRRLAGQLHEYVTSDRATRLVFQFPPTSAHNERERLKAPSTAAVLRALQLDAGYHSETLPMLGGGFAFDYIDSFEQLPEVQVGQNTFPDYQFLVAEQLLRIDHLTQTASIECVALSQDAVTESVEKLSDAVASFVAESTESTPTPTSALPVMASVTDADFRGHVERLQGNIADGDIYQVVPARSFSASCPDAFAAYRSLRAVNPSPYMFYFHGLAAGEPFELFGASPESNLKFTATSREVQLYPIAGTRPRGLTADGQINHELDIRAELEMRTDAKEMAEHIMLVDLARNDLARVAVPATRKVAELLQVDRYSRVMHLVSRVTATLDSDFDALDAYRACMNMGTLTGAPKLRAMELIRETEGVRRGSYGGAVGYLSGDGSMDTAIVIRSAYVQGGIATVQAGAGVVRDSQPQAEADETVHKAYAVLTAIATAQSKFPEVQR